MKKIILILFCMAYNFANAQQSNLVKYWQYRNRLDNQFLVKGIESPCQNYGGLSVPISERNNNGKSVNHVKFGDDLKDLGWYVGVLSTEFLLLSAGNDYVGARKSLDDLYMAMKAIERFDTKAEWLAMPKQMGSCTSQNGFLVRDEVGNAYFTNNFKKLFPNFIGTPVQGTNYNTDLTDNDPENHFSTDHIMSILMGYALVRRCIPPQLSHSSGYNFYTESYQFTNRIMNRMSSNNWINTVPNTPPYSLSIANVANSNRTPANQILNVLFDGVITTVTGIPSPMQLSNTPVNFNKGFEMLSMLPGWVGAANYNNPAPVSGPFTSNNSIKTVWQELQPGGKGADKVRNSKGYVREIIYTLAALSNTWEVCPKETIKVCLVPTVVQDGCNVWLDKTVDPCFGVWGGCSFTVKECLIPHFRDECAQWLDKTFDNCLKPKENNTLRALCDYGKDTKQEFYSLLHMFLFNKRISEDWWMPQGNFESILNSAPCDGPRYKPSDNPNDLGVPNWRVANRWEKADEAVSGSLTDNSGYFNGLDYMLTFNLFSLTYGHLLTDNGIPQYTTSRGNYIENDIRNYPNLSVGTIQSPYSKNVIKSVISTSYIGSASTQGNVAYTAGELITLSPGFTVRSGSEFKAKIAPYSNCNGPYNYRIENARLGDLETETNPTQEALVSQENVIYPNPISSGFINFGHVANEYSLTNGTGKVLSRGRLAERIDISGLSKGIYLLKLDDKTEKIIIQ